MNDWEIFATMYVTMMVFVLVLLQKNNGRAHDLEEVCTRIGLALLWPISLTRDVALGLAHHMWKKEQEAKRKAQQQEDEELH